LLERHLPPAPASVLDVGGGTGAHARWLVDAGYEVRLVDPVERHVTRAREYGIDAVHGDARDLDAEDESYDVVLLLGPLYHLIDREDRLRALGEARRVARTGGVVAAAAVNRFASLLDGVAEKMLADEVFRAVVAQDLADGQHRNPTRNPDAFTVAYFHHPDDLVEELREAAFDDIALYGVEGPGGAFLDREPVDPDWLETLVWAARAVEQEPTALAFSFHLLAVGVKP
jgi:ubiquinone/menaquinone biosynthesis C-methylase UbiE